MKHIEAVSLNLIDTFSTEHLPIDTVECGEKFEICTSEATMSQKIISDVNAKTLLPSRILRVTGPIYINGISAGDTIVISIHSIQLMNRGRAWFGSWIGLLKDEVHSAYLQEFTITNDVISFPNGLCVNTKPMIGTIGVTPIKKVSCLQPGDYGGNMDIPTLATGSKLYLKTEVNGGLVALGDVHASMGYGEVLGTGIEIGSVITLSIRKYFGNIPINIPIHESRDSFEIIKSHVSLNYAMKDAVLNAIKFIQYINNCTFNEAYVIVGELCDLAVTQVVNPASSVLVRIPKAILKRKFEG